MTSEALAGRALDQLLEVTVLLGDDMSRHLARRGLTEAKAHALYLLAATGPSTQRALADALDVSPRTVTTLVDELSEAGLVTREPHPTDRRATQVTLSDRGREVAEALVTGRRELAEALFADVRAEQLASLVDGLEATLDRLRPMVEEAT